MATVERSGVVMVLDRDGVHGEPMRWLSERLELVRGTGGYSVLQHPAEREPLAHVEGAPLEEAQAVYRALASLLRRAR